MINKSAVIYEAYARNHSREGDFAGLERDLPRIRELGADCLWLMPIHPIGKVRRKGTLGSPYAIADYLSVNPEYGSEADFTRLVRAAHGLGMGLMIDLVFNHTAHDAALAREHPEWYRHDAQGKLTCSVPDWSDVVELDYASPGLREYMLAVVEKWARLGVDGFRCDVASLVPLDFWLSARERAAKVNSEIFWLAESVHAGWVAARRRDGLFALSDGELYNAFDITYDYDIYAAFENVLLGNLDVSLYLDMLSLQEGIYPRDFIKLRYVENHDTERIMAAAPGRAQALAWTALQAFNRGCFLIYAGQESACTRTPSCFDRDPTEWGEYELSAFLRSLAGVKKHPAVQSGTLYWTGDDPLVSGAWYAGRESLVGLFNVRASSGYVPVALPDGEYHDLILGATIKVSDSILRVPETAAIFECPLEQPPAERKTLLV